MSSPLTEPNYLLEGFHKIDTDLQELMVCFQEVLQDLGEPRVAAFLPWLPLSSLSSEEFYHQDSLSDRDILRTTQAFSIAFQLLNIVEANASARTRRLRESGSGLIAERGLWGEKLHQLQQAGYTAEEIATLLPQIQVEPVFTAHPTEAKRGAVLEQHRILYQLLQAKDQQQQTPSEQKKSRSDIKVCLEKLWRSGEIFLDQPSIADERREILFYFDDILPKAVLRLDERLRSAWEEVGFPSELLATPATYPQLHFGTWVGGDRDGHPFVTAAVTRETLQELRLRALLLVHRHLTELSQALPLSKQVQQPSKELLLLIERLTQELGELGSSLAKQYPDEPWRHCILLIQAKLPLEWNHGKSAILSYSSTFFQSPSEVLEALQIVATSLEEVKARRLVHNLVWPVMRQLQVFGFHLAHLDIRQNSSFHDRAMMQLLEAAGVPEAESFLEWSEEKRLAYFRKELSTSRSLLPEHLDYSTLGKEAEALLTCYETLRSHLEKHGEAGLGSLIVSMTRHLSDLLLVVLLAREGGLTAWNGSVHYARLPIVPLFETLEDLVQSPSLLEEYLQEPSTIATHRFLADQSTSKKKYPSNVPIHEEQGILCAQSHSIPKVHENTGTEVTPPFTAIIERSKQEVMIGYSDSNKDCGIMASQWGLHEAQQAMTKIGHSCHVRMEFFHGRGGTISRGAGPTHLFLDALPKGSLQGDFRMTEQGETIAQKYGTSSTATYHLELLLAGVTGISLLHHQQQENNPSAFSVATFLAQESCHTYQSLVQSEGFMTFYEQATPLDALEVSRIGSRPKRRSNQRSLSDLRAIPWVFSWNQARYFLPGWFGVGSALEALQKQQPILFQQLVKEHRKWPFLNYVLSNVETNLASAHLGIMKNYASLVTDLAIRERIFEKIALEFKKTEDQLHQVFGNTLEKRRPRMGKTLALRAKALDHLHEQQIATLAAWRQAQQDDPKRAEALLPRVLLSVNAIASGLRTTG